MHKMSLCCGDIRHRSRNKPTSYDHRRITQFAYLDPCRDDIWEGQFAEILATGLHHQKYSCAGFQIQRALLQQDSHSRRYQTAGNAPHCSYGRRYHCLSTGWHERLKKRYNRLGFWGSLLTMRPRRFAKAAASSTGPRVVHQQAGLVHCILR